MRLVYLRRAREEIAAILKYIAVESRSAAAAEDFITSLRRKCRSLAALPGTMGRPRPEYGQDIRSYAFHSYVIFFRYEADKFIVVRILEGHRDIDREFSEPDD